MLLPPSLFRQKPRGRLPAVTFLGAPRVQMGHWDPVAGLIAQGRRPARPAAAEGIGVRAKTIETEERQVENRGSPEAVGHRASGPAGRTEQWSVLHRPALLRGSTGSGRASGLRPESLPPPRFHSMRCRILFASWD